MKNQTEELCIHAVNKDGMVLRMIRIQSPKICINAVKNNGLALQYVKEQTQEICNIKIYIKMQDLILHTDTWIDIWTGINTNIIYSPCIIILVILLEGTVAFIYQKLTKKIELYCVNLIVSKIQSIHHIDMENLWQKCVIGQNDKPDSSSLGDPYKIMANDFSYVLSHNPNTGQHNVIDILTIEQRSKHPKFIHSKGVIGKFKYKTRVAQFDTSIKSQLCTQNMTGIFRFGPANLGAVNMLGLGFKFFGSNSDENESIYNTLMIGGTAEKINPEYPPTVGDVKYYSTDISSIDTKINKKVDFLSRAFTDLVVDPNILDVSVFIQKYKRIFFEFNPQLMKSFDDVLHNETIIDNIKHVINAKFGSNYTMGTFYALHEHGYKIELGDLILLEPVIISNFADSHLFFQHDIDPENVKSKKSGRCAKPIINLLNENPDSQSSCIFAQRIKHLFM